MKVLLRSLSALAACLLLLTDAAAQFPFPLPGQDAPRASAAAPALGRLLPGARSRPVAVVIPEGKPVAPRELVRSLSGPLRLTARQQEHLRRRLEWRVDLGLSPRAPEDDPATIDLVLASLEPDQAMAFVTLLGPQRVEALRLRIKARALARAGMPATVTPQPQRVATRPPVRDRLRLRQRPSRRSAAGGRRGAVDPLDRRSGDTGLEGLLGGRGGF